jgi:hypothetical protein
MRFLRFAATAKGREFESHRQTENLLPFDSLRTPSLRCRSCSEGKLFVFVMSRASWKSAGSINHKNPLDMAPKGISVALGIDVSRK